MKYVIQCREDPCTGLLGLCLKEMPRLDNDEPETGGGLLIAHDLLEHVNGVSAIGSIGDEIQALGAAWYVRFQHGVNNPADPGAGSYYTSEQNVAHDISRLALKVGDGAAVGIPTPKTRKHIFDEEFESIVHHAKKSVRDEASYRWDAEYDREHAFSDINAKYWPCVIPHLRAGYNAANRRYRGKEVLRLFSEVQRVVDRGCRPEYEGQQWALHMNIAGRTARVEELYTGEEY